MGSRYELVQCPYDKAHLIQAGRLQHHLIKCRKNHLDQEFATCPFNACHEFPRSELQSHLSRCPDRVCLNEEFHLKSATEPGRVKSGNLAIPDFDIESPACSEDWDFEEDMLTGGGNGDYPKTPPYGTNIYRPPQPVSAHTPPDAPTQTETIDEMESLPPQPRMFHTSIVSNMKKTQDKDGEGLRLPRNLPRALEQLRNARPLPKGGHVPQDRPTQRPAQQGEAKQKEDTLNKNSQGQIYQGQTSQGKDVHSQSSQGQNLHDLSIRAQNPHGQSSQGQNLYSQSSQGQNPHSQSFLGQNPHSQSSQGQNPHSQSFLGQNPHSQSSQGQNPHSQSSQGQNSHSQSSQGQNPHSRSYQGQNPHSQSSQGQNPHSQSSQGQNPHSQSSQGQNLYSQNSQGQNVHSLQKEGQNCDSQGESAQVHVPQGQRPNIQSPNGKLLVDPIKVAGLGRGLLRPAYVSKILSSSPSRPGPSDVAGRRESQTTCKVIPAQPRTAQPQSIITGEKALKSRFQEATHADCDPATTPTGRGRGRGILALSFYAGKNTDMVPGVGSRSSDPVLPIFSPVSDGQTFNTHLADMVPGVGSRSSDPVLPIFSPVSDGQTFNTHLAEKPRFVIPKVDDYGAPR